MGQVSDLTDAETDLTKWSTGELHALSVLEKDIGGTTVPLRIITDTEPLTQALTNWSKSHPGKISELLYLPGMAG